MRNLIHALHLVLLLGCPTGCPPKPVPPVEPPIPEPLQATADCTQIQGAFKVTSTFESKTGNCTPIQENGTISIVVLAMQNTSPQMWDAGGRFGDKFYDGLVQSYSDTACQFVLELPESTKSRVILSWDLIISKDGTGHGEATGTDGMGCSWTDKVKVAK